MSGESPWKKGFAKGRSKSTATIDDVKYLLSEGFAGTVSKGTLPHWDVDERIESMERWMESFEMGMLKGKSKGKEWLSRVCSNKFHKGVVKGKSKGWSKGVEEGIRKGKGIGSRKRPLDDSIDCAYFEECLEFVKSLPSELQDCVDFTDHSRCFCTSCHRARGDYDTYPRGDMLYALPIGWVRFALAAGGVQAKVLGAFSDWHVAFHSTTSEAIPAILGTGRLVRPGDSVAAWGGESITIRPGHISKPFWRWNNYTWTWEWFDPCQIFCSPSIRYCDLPCYAKPTIFTAPNGWRYKAKVALQLRLRPGSYSIGQSTASRRHDGSAWDEHEIDPHISNDEIEWYTDGSEHGSHVLTGLMVKLENAA